MLDESRNRDIELIDPLIERQRLQFKLVAGSRHLFDHGSTGLHSAIDVIQSQGELNHGFRLPRAAIRDMFHQSRRCAQLFLLYHARLFLRREFVPLRISG